MCSKLKETTYDNVSKFCKPAAIGKQLDLHNYQIFIRESIRRNPYSVFSKLYFYLVWSLTVHYIYFEANKI